MNYQLKFPALACPALIPSVPYLPCQLAFVYDDAARQASLLLELTTDGAQTIVLQYDAPNIKSGGRLSRGSDLRSVSSLEREQLQWSKEDSRTDFKELSFDIKQPCSVWHPQLPLLGSKPGHESSLCQYVELARATTLHFFFDYKHVPSRHQTMLKAFRTAAKGLQSYPVEAFLVGQGMMKSSWDVFGPCDTVGAPPAYHVPRKRRRSTSPNSPTQLNKRTNPLSPTGSHSSEKTIPFSPSKEADALRTALRIASPEFDFQTEAINAAVSRQLSAHLDDVQAQAIEVAVSKQLSAHLHDVQAQAVDAAVDRQLPTHLDWVLHTEAIDAAVDMRVQTYLNNLIPTLLPDTLQTLLTGAPKSNSSSPAPSFTSFDSRGNRYPKLPTLTPLGTTLIPHLCTHLAEQFQQYQAHQLQRFKRLIDKTLDTAERSAYDDRARETAEFETVMEEHRAEVEMVKTDTIRDLWRETEDVFARSREEGWALGEDINEQLSGLCDKINSLKKVRLKKMVIGEVSRQRRKKRVVARGVGVRVVRDQQKLLGRRREPDDVEWVDC